MTRQEALKLLRDVAAADHRTIGETDVDMWHDCLDDIGYDDARAAVIGHFRSSTAWLMPAHVRTRAMAMRRERLDQVPLPAPGPELTDSPARYRESLSESIRSIADGKSIRRALPRVRAESRPPSGTTADLDRFRALTPSKRKLAGPQLAAQQAPESRAGRKGAGAA